MKRCMWKVGRGQGIEGHDMQWKCCMKTYSFPLLNGKASSFRQRTQSICSIYTCEVESKASSPCAFHRSLQSSCLHYWHYWKCLRNIMKILFLYRKHVANSMSSSPLRVWVFRISIPPTLNSKPQGDIYIIRSFSVWRPGTTKSLLG